MVAITIDSQGINSSPLDKMATITQTIYLDAFLWMKTSVFWLTFIEVCS